MYFTTVTREEYGTVIFENNLYSVFFFKFSFAIFVFFCLSFFIKTENAVVKPSNVYLIGNFEEDDYILEVN